MTTAVPPRACPSERVAVGGARILDQPMVANEPAAWKAHRNTIGGTGHWRFTTADARIKLHHLYPQYAR